MINVGSTITMEDWDVSLKSNLDWNHAWATAPANIVARYTLGVRPAAPGFATAIIHPQLGSLLSHVDGVVPTIRGPIHVIVSRGASAQFTMTVTLPANMTAQVALPITSGQTCSPILDGKAATATVSGGTSWISPVGSGTHQLSCP